MKLAICELEFGNGAVSKLSSPCAAPSSPILRAAAYWAAHVTQYRSKHDPDCGCRPTPVTVTEQPPDLGGGAGTASESQLGPAELE